MPLSSQNKKLWGSVAVPTGWRCKADEVTPQGELMNDRALACEKHLSAKTQLSAERFPCKTGVREHPLQRVPGGLFPSRELLDGSLFAP